MFRSPGVGGGVTLTFACYPNYFLGFKLLNFAMFLVSSFLFVCFCLFFLLLLLLFFQLFYWYVRQFEQVFFRYVNFYTNFGGASLKMFVFMAFL